MKFSTIIAAMALGSIEAFSPSASLSRPTSLSAFFSGDSYTSPRMDEPDPEIDPRRKNPDEQPDRAPVRMPVIDMGDGKQMDVISRLLQDRILLLGQGVDDFGYTQDGIWPAVRNYQR